MIDQLSMLEHLARLNVHHCKGRREHILRVAFACQALGITIVVVYKTCCMECPLQYVVRFGTSVPGRAVCRLFGRCYPSSQFLYGRFFFLLLCSTRSRRYWLDVLLRRRLPTFISCCHPRRWLLSSLHDRLNHSFVRCRQWHPRRWLPICFVHLHPRIWLPAGSNFWCCWRLEPC